MKRIGLIREKKEIEYLILYVMSFLKETIRYEDLADMAICDGGFGYFEFSDAMAELSGVFRRRFGWRRDALRRVCLRGCAAMP